MTHPAERDAALQSLAAEFRRRADPSIAGIWREACDLLDQIVKERTTAREDMARAWDEGWHAGCNDQQYGDDNAEPWTPNPYAAESAFTGRSCRPIPPATPDHERGSARAERMGP